MNRNLASTILFCALCLAMLRPALAVTNDWLPVGNPGNSNDPATGNLYGGAGYAYRIDKYDVTNAQYAEFLNTKDPTGANTLGLWNSYMADATYGGISFHGGNVNGSKSVLTAGRQNHPANEVSWYDAIRFANWLNNGQGNGDTETGAYTLLGGTPTPSNGLSITRNTGATVFLPNENEWYKAAYYDPGTNSYFRYATSDHSTPIASAPTSLANHANYNNVVGDLTDVGAYTNTASRYGAFDMNGNVFQWNEALINGLYRGQRGGAFPYDSSFLVSSFFSDDFPTDTNIITGFRVASVPEPADATSLLVVGAVLAVRRQSRIVLHTNSNPSAYRACQLFVVLFVSDTPAVPASHRWLNLSIPRKGASV
jgi:sulfatase modifying factor 1